MSRRLDMEAIEIGETVTFPLIFAIQPRISMKLPPKSSSPPPLPSPLDSPIDFAWFSDWNEENFWNFSEAGHGLQMGLGCCKEKMAGIVPMSEFKNQTPRVLRKVRGAL
ncbi:hypothetical protein Pyn_21206 [Prunus yedoensis var. nudiflora]|uniref:Uncharacterized protein n=1 Tax=Prunus yedoensis var. nudiflora TaxID=2094558 RepID=A0A314UY54_PRUYE|nr:hypothetical protein Pyn_21206 [Prunus yedoensis var. nudiflora]